MTRTFLYNGMFGALEVPAEPDASNLSELMDDEVFRRGQCHSFALAASTLTGGEVVGIGWTRAGAPEWPGRAPEHFMVRSGDWLLDAHGWQTLEEVALAYGWADPEPVTEDDIIRMSDENPGDRRRVFYPLMVEEARPYAEALLAEHGPEPELLD